MKYDQKNENDQYTPQCRENESRFHYLCIAVSDMYNIFLGLQLYTLF